MSQLRKESLICLVLVTIMVKDSTGLMDGLYCGQHNCYDVLGVTSESSKAEISKAYRQLAKKYHPDRHTGEENKFEASEMFKLIATAYETLKDDEARADYDYVLLHPRDYYRNYYRYYRRTKIDINIVIFVFITVLSLYQYYASYWKYKMGMRYLASNPKYRSMALQKAQEKGLLSNLKKSKRKSKQEIKVEEDRIIYEILEENMDIRGGFAKPKIRDVLWVQLVLLPYNIYSYVSWYLRWLWNFNIMKREYGEEEKHYIIRKHLGYSAIQYEQWKEILEEESKRKLAESAKYKQHRRFMKKGGPGRIYFDDS